MNSTKRTTLNLIISLSLLGMAFYSYSMEPEPRQWNHLPIDTNFGGGGYAYTDADILINPALLLTDVEMKMHTLAGKYIRSFKAADFTEALFSMWLARGVK